MNLMIFFPGGVGMLTNTSDVTLEIESVSPVTLNDHWSRLARLIVLASLAAIGSVGNVFMISAVMIEDYLRRRGIIFIIFGLRNVSNSI